MDSYKIFDPLTGERKGIYASRFSVSIPIIGIDGRKGAYGGLEVIPATLGDQKLVSRRPTGDWSLCGTHTR